MTLLSLVFIIFNFENDFSYEHVITEMTTNDFKALNTLQIIASRLAPDMVNQSIHFSQLMLLLSNNTVEIPKKKYLNEFQFPN